MQMRIAGPADALRFSWKPVNGAVAYEVVVLDQAGHAAWSWTGRSITVAPPDHAPIPSEGAATVAAYDANGAPVGLSDPVEFQVVGPERARPSR